MAVHDLHQDLVTAEVVEALIRRASRPILLKGVVVARWLYWDGTPRHSGDIDLLVDPARWRQATEALRALGFEGGQRGWQDVSRAFRRESDGASVDLHRSLFGLEAPVGEIWGRLSQDTDRLLIGGVVVDTLGLPARTMQLATHAAQHGYEQQLKPIEDLRRGALQLELGCWRDAAALAGELGGAAAFATGLSLCREGQRVADQLGLSLESSPAVALHVRGAPPLVMGLESLVRFDSTGRRLGFLARKLVPDPAYMRRSSALARRGPAGLSLAYLVRPVWMAIRLPRALLAWRRTRTAAERDQHPNHQHLA